MEMNFCRRCGKPLTNVHDHVYKCSDGHLLYANQSPAVAVFFISQDNKQVLLSTRGIEPNKGMLDAFGGFLDREESFEDAAVRELREELDLEPDEYEPLRYLTSSYDAYTYEKERIPFVSTIYWTRLKTDRKLQGHDDVASADWYNLSAVDPASLHSNDVRDGFHLLRTLFLQTPAVGY